MGCDADSQGTPNQTPNETPGHNDPEPLRSCIALGSRVVYFEHGTGTPLVLVHGMFGDHMDWSEVLGPLGEKHRVIALDLPGFGDSDKNLERCAPELTPGCTSKLTPEYFVESLESIFSTLDVRGAVLVGNSFGGLLCSLYVAAHPEQVQSLVLVSSAGMREYSAAERAVVAEHFSEQNLLLMRPEHVEPLFALNFARLTAARANYLERQRAKLKRADYKAYAHVLAECAAMAFAIPIVPVLGKVKLPIVLLWGDSDPVFPVALAREALPALPQARLALVAGASHMPQMDQPEAVVNVLEELAREEAGRGREK